MTDLGLERSPLPFLDAPPPETPCAIDGQRQTLAVEAAEAADANFLGNSHPAILHLEKNNTKSQHETFPPLFCIFSRCCNSEPA